MVTWKKKIEIASSVLVTERHRQTSLYDALRQNEGLKTLELIGDAAGPGLIADAVYSATWLHETLNDQTRMPKLSGSAGKLSHLRISEAEHAEINDDHRGLP